jgi:hypothetical protein
VDAEDRSAGPWEQLYEDWVESRKRDASIEKTLVSTCREAWANDVEHDRESILYFISRRKDAALADLIVEGLASTRRSVAWVAAVQACVTDVRVFDFGREIRPAFRALVRRFPETEGFRPPRFYGHEAGDTDDWTVRPFVNIYEDWRRDYYPRRDRALSAKLAADYRETWKRGDGVDRAFVLLFLSANSRQQDPALATDGRDLAIDALMTDDPVLAPEAALNAGFLLRQGIDLGDDVGDKLEALASRIPDIRREARSALWELEKRDEAATDDDP